MLSNRKPRPTWKHPQGKRRHQRHAEISALGGREGGGLSGGLGGEPLLRQHDACENVPWWAEKLADAAQRAQRAQ